MRAMAALAGARRDPVCCDYASRAGMRAWWLRTGTVHCSSQRDGTPSPSWTQPLRRLHACQATVMPSMLCSNLHAQHAHLTNLLLLHQQLRV